jgi:hypothetical protein
LRSHGASIALHYALSNAGIIVSEAGQGLLFVEFLGAANVVFAHYMTLVFAMLTASWFLAAKKPRSIAVLFLGRYSLGAFAIGTGVYGAFADFFALHRYIFDHNTRSGPLQWLGPLRAGGPIPTRMGEAIALTTVALPWLGSIVFFTVSRREHRSTTTQDPDPGGSVQ